MKDLIEALTIFLKHGNPHNPTHCEHDEMYVCIDAQVSAEDAVRLDTLGFFKSSEGWKSFRYGSA